MKPESIFPAKDWQRATPESQGISSRALLRALEAIEASGKDLHSMLVVRHGRLVFEHYFAPYTEATRHRMYSCSKTFTSMMVGIAQGKGLLSLSDRVIDYFPEVTVEHPNDNLRQMTLRDLLMMGSGHGEDTFGPMVERSQGGWPSVFLNQVVDHQPGTHFVYNTGATYMLSNILTRVTRRTALELANQWLFGPLGIEGAQWETDPEGISMGGTGLFIRPLDMARFGLLLLNEGVWAGEQLIPSEYVREASSYKIDNRNPQDPNQHLEWRQGYCYQIWRCSFGAYRADGMGGQYIVVFPEQDAVVVFTSGLGADIGFPLEVVREHLAGAFQAQPLPEEREARGQLAALAHRLRFPQPQLMPEAAEQLPWGTRYVLGDNPMKMGGIRLERQGDVGVLHTDYEGRAVELPFAWGAPRINPDRPPFEEFLPISLAGTACWTAGGLRIRMRLVGDPSSFVMDFCFEGERLHLKVRAVLSNEDYDIEGRAAI